MKKYCFIYKTTNLINGKIYIGRQNNNYKYYLGSGVLIKRSIKKYGKKNFKKEILEYCTTEEQLNEREIYWIEFYNSRDRNIGYNIDIGGGANHNIPHTEEIKRKIALRNKGKKLSKETILKISETIKKNGYRHSEETKIKIRNFNLGLKRSEETKKRISEVQRGKKLPSNHPWLSGTLIPWNKGKEWGNEAKEKMRNSQLIQEKLQCPYCGKVMNVTTSKRYHFDNCKLNPNSNNKLSIRERYNIIVKEKKTKKGKIFGYLNGELIEKFKSVRQLIKEKDIDKQKAVVYIYEGKCINGILYSYETFI